eukprot:4685219-Amphidinium_carterae.1
MAGSLSVIDRGCRRGGRRTRSVHGLGGPCLVLERRSRYTAYVCVVGNSRACKSWCSRSNAYGHGLLPFGRAIRATNFVETAIAMIMSTAAYLSKILAESTPPAAEVVAFIPEPPREGPEAPGAAPLGSSMLASLTLPDVLQQGCAMYTWWPAQ